MPRRRRGNTLVPTLSVASRVGRMGVWLLLPALLGYGLVVWRMNAWFDDGLAGLSSGVEGSAGWAWADAAGRFTGEHFMLVPAADTGLPGIRSRRYTLETPGWGWMIARSLGVGDDGFPPYLRLALDGVTVDEPAAAKPSWGSPWRLALLGCPERLPADLMQDHPEVLTPAISWAMRFHPATGLTIESRWDARGAARWTGEFRLRPAEGLPLREALWAAPVEAVRVEWEDAGLNASRTRSCASALGVDPATFVMREHAVAFGTWLRAAGFRLDGESQASYLGFASGPGILELDGAAHAAPSLEVFAGEPRIALGEYGFTLRRDGGPAVPLVLLDASFYSAGAVDPSMASPMTEVLPAKPATPAIPLGEVIAFERLEGLLGATIEVATVSGSVRTGTLTEYSAVGLSLQVGGSPGFRLNLSRPEIVRVRVLRLP